jgi:phosphate transport system protein
MVEQAMLSAIDSLRQRDSEAAARIYESDQQINDKRFAIENAILILIATQQPMAHDLRLLAAILEIITELERMGDYAKGIAKVTIRLKDAEIDIPNRDLERMANLAVGMLHRALGAFVNEDPNEASAIPAEDDAVDNLYNQIYHGLVESMIANPATIDQANLLMWVTHNLERMADRVTKFANERSSSPPVTCLNWRLRTTKIPNKIHRRIITCHCWQVILLQMQDTLASLY